MPSGSPSIVQRIRSFSLSIGQLTFGGFLLVLAVIMITSVASVIAIRHIDSTFAELQPLREQFDAAIADTPDPVIAATLFQTQSRIASALLAHNPSAAEQAAQSMRALTIANPRLRTAVDDYAEAIIAISIRERQIADIDKEVLGSEGRLIGQVTELLRQVSSRRGHILARDFARTLTEAKWLRVVRCSAGV